MVVDKTTSLTTAVGGAAGVNSPTNAPQDTSKAGGTQGRNFSDLLSGKISDKPIAGAAANPGSTIEGVRFSQHALERMANRGIMFKPEDIARLNEAVDKASKKGSRESLVLMGDNAFIVSVKNKTVVTAMDRETMKENIFTNIDSTVIL